VARYTDSFETTASPEAVFAYFEDFTNGPEWDPGIAAVERLDDGPIDVGSRFALDLLIAGRVQRYVYTVEVHDPTRRITFATRTGRSVGIDAFTVVPTPEGTRLDFEGTFTFTGLLGALADPLLQIAYTRIARKAAAGIDVALGHLAAAEAA
jgi:carbon monoxide dehydrogenase subunit G